jgi:hypothetical protein
LAVEYASVSGSLMYARVDVMLRIVPRCVRRCGIECFAHSSGPVRLVAIVSCQSTSASVSTGSFFGSAIAALF